MSKYFKPYHKNEEDPTYPEAVKYIIRPKIEGTYGIVTCSNKKLGELWREFSSDNYAANFMGPNDLLIKEFVNWLEGGE